MNERKGNLLKKVYVALFLVAVVTIVGVFASDLVEERARLEERSRFEERYCIEEGSRTPIPTGSPTPTWQEWRASAEEIPYMTLVHDAEQHKGTLVYYRGRVARVFDRPGEFQLMVDVRPDNKHPQDALVFLLRDKGAPVRVQNGDIIAFVGRMNGAVPFWCVMDGDEGKVVLDITPLALIIENEQ